MLPLVDGRSKATTVLKGYSTGDLIRSQISPCIACRLGNFAAEKP